MESASAVALLMGAQNSGAIEKAASELNHHIAGYALICVAAIILASQLSPALRRLRYIWPLLLICLGMFLAAWSDAEIWPRGPLPWTWLIQHDAEARQHKIYAALLLLLGAVEFFRARGTLKPVWRRWSFPVLAICGAALLTMHAHGGTSGLPQGWDPSQPIPFAASVTPIPVEMPQHDHAAMHQHDHLHHAQAEPANPAHAEDHSGHVMTAEMLHIQRQHIWMTIVGVVLAISKALVDSPNIRTRFLRFVWPSAMACLGLLLVLYRE
jgi:hypothetical protein